MASLRNAKDDELDPQYDNEQLVDVLADEPTAVPPQDEGQALPTQVQYAKSHPRTKRSKQRFHSSRGSGVPYTDWHHHRLKKKYLNRLILKYMDSNFLSLESSSINLLLDPSVPRPIHMYD
jgi:hypothetical protein